MTFENTGLELPGRGARLTYVVVILLTAAAVCWLMAFSVSLAPKTPLLVVGAPIAAVSGDRLPVRVVAIDEASSSRVKGAFRVSVMTPSGADNTSTVVGNMPADVPTPQYVGEVTLRVEGPLDHSAPASFETTLALQSRLSSRAQLTFRPWTQSVLQGQGPPVYPLDGDVLSTKRSKILLLTTRGPRLEQIQGHPAQTADAYGRSLRLERKDIRVTAPLSVSPGTEFDVEVDVDEPLELDLLVDGWARRSTLMRGRTTLQMPIDVRPDAVFVIHVSRRPFPQGKGVFHIGRVASDNEGFTNWLASRLGASQGETDPLLAQLIAGRLDDTHQDAAWLALSRRLVPQRLRAPRIGPDSAQQRASEQHRRRAAAAPWRWAYRLCSALVGLAAIGAIVRILTSTPTAQTQGAPWGKKRIHLGGALGLILGLSMLFLLDWTLG